MRHDRFGSGDGFVMMGGKMLKRRVERRLPLYRAYASQGGAGISLIG